MGRVRDGKVRRVNEEKGKGERGGGIDGKVRRVSEEKGNIKRDG